MSIADYLQRKEALQQQKQQNLIGNILSAVKTGTDVWGALQESGKYKPGSDFMKYETMKRDWGNEDFQKHLDQTLQFNQDWLRFQNENPGASEEEKKWKFLQTPEGKQASEQSYQEWLKTYNVEQGGRIDLANIAAAAAQPGKNQDRKAKMMKAIDDAFGTAQVRGDWFVIDPSTGAKVVNPDTIDQLRSNILMAVQVYEPNAAELKSLEPYINNLLAGKVAQPGGTPGLPIAQPPGKAPSAEQVANNLMGAGIANAVTGNALGALIAPALGFASTALVPAAIAEGLYRIITGNSLIDKVPGLREWVNKQRPGLGDKLFPREMYVTQNLRGIYKRGSNPG